jgi:hypothetical protein
MSRLETLLAWWPAVLRYGGFGLLAASFVLYVATVLVTGTGVVVPSPFLLTFGSMMAIGEGGKAIKDLASMPSSPPIPGQKET